METTKIHDPVVLSSGALPSGTSRYLAAALASAAILAGTYAAYNLWQKNQRS